MALPAKFRTNAGFLVKQTTEEPRGPGQITSTTVRSPINERRPDLFFLLTSPTESVTDTRSYPHGFLLNFANVQKRIGSPVQTLKPDLAASKELDCAP
jgi:hypothetical protein